MNMKKQVDNEMQQVVDHFIEELKNIRTGRAMPGMLDNVSVEIYGTQMRLRDAATVTASGPRQLTVTPFDMKNTAGIGKALQQANLGFSIVVEANLIRIMIPEMSEIVRKEMIKLLHKKREEIKISIRHVRAKYNKQAKADGKVNDEEVKRTEKEVQELTDKYCTLVDEKSKAKESEISTI